MSIENDELQRGRPTLHEQSLLRVPQMPGAMSGWFYSTIARVQTDIRPKRLVATSKNGGGMQKGIIVERAPGVVVVFCAYTFQL